MTWTLPARRVWLAEGMQRPHPINHIRNVVEGRTDAPHAEALVNQLRAWDRTLTEARLSLAYQNYVSSVSTAEMAMSLETAALLADLCRWLEPPRILDLGSGFSSYVVRRWAATSGASVISVDDSDDWLEKSRRFVVDQGLDPAGMVTWADFTPLNAFDLISHDLGRMPRRTAVLPDVFAMASPGAVVLLDDLHKRSYARAVCASAQNAGFEVRSLRTWTLDRAGRFAGVARRVD